MVKLIPSLGFAVFLLCGGFLHYSLGYEQNSITKIIAKLFYWEETLTFIVNPDIYLTFQEPLPNPLYIISVSHKNLCNNLINCAYVIFARNQDDFVSTLFNFMKHCMWHKSNSPRAKFLIILKEGFDINKLLLYLWNLDIMNSIIIVTDNYTMYQSSPFWKKNNCGKVVNHIVVENSNHPRRIKFMEFDTFPSCNISVPLLVDNVGTPYAFKKGKQYHGLWVEPLKLIGRKLLLNLHLFSAPDCIERNYLSNKIIVNGINNRQYDVAVNIWRIVKTYQDLNPTDIFYYDKSAWIVPKPKLVNKYEIIWKVVAYETCIFIIFVAFVVTLLCYIIAKCLQDPTVKDFATCIEKVFLMTLSLPITQLPRNINMRVIFFCYSIYSIHITLYFKGKLSSVLARPVYQKGIETFQDLLDSDLALIISYPHLGTLNDSHNPELNKFLSKMNIQVVPIKSRAEYVVNYRNASLQIYSAFLNTNIDIKDSIRLIKGKFGYEIESFYVLRNGHPILPRFNVMLNRIVEAGLANKWFLDIKTIDFTNPIEEKNDVILSLDKIAGEFFILGIGYIVAAFVLLIELTAYRFEKFVLKAKV